MPINRLARRYSLYFLAAFHFYGCACVQERCRVGWTHIPFCREIIRVNRDAVDLQSPFFISKKTLIADPLKGGVAGDRGTKISFPVILNAAAYSSFTFVPDSLVMDGKRQHAACVLVSGAVTTSEILENKEIQREIRGKFQALSGILPDTGMPKESSGMPEGDSASVSRRLAAEKSGTTLTLTDSKTTGNYTFVCKDFVPYWGKEYRLDFRMAAVRRSDASTLVMPGRIHFSSAYDGWLVSPAVGLGLSLAFILMGVQRAYEN